MVGFEGTGEKHQGGPRQIFLMFLKNFEVAKFCLGPPLGEKVDFFKSALNGLKLPNMALDFHFKRFFRHFKRFFRVFKKSNFFT